MMKLNRTIALGLAAMTLAAGVAAAQDAVEAAVKARKGQFEVMAQSMGVLGGMARGNIPYNAQAASAAAGNIATITKLNQSALWPAGSHNGTLKNTRAQPNIFENVADFTAKWETLGKRATALQAAAGNGLDALRPAIGGVGGACQDCHEKYRAPAQ
jgi:cytochrome c556